jgi:hypothetical protein
MIESLSAISFLVPSYDEGLAFFVGALGFTVQEDVPPRRRKTLGRRDAVPGRRS